MVSLYFAMRRRIFLHRDHKRFGTPVSNARHGQGREIHAFAPAVDFGLFGALQGKGPGFGARVRGEGFGEKEKRSINELRYRFQMDRVRILIWNEPGPFGTVRVLVASATVY